MQIILEPDTIPERGTFQIHETVTIQVSADEARRSVDRWLLHEVNAQMGAEPPALVVGVHSVWRVPVTWSAPDVGRAGVVGVVEVDILTGDINLSAETKVELQRSAQDLSAGLPTYRSRETPEAYLANQVAATHGSGRPYGDPRDLLINRS